MSDWHFGMDYDMWLYPPVDWTSPDYNFELPEPIEAANVEGTLLVNAEDAIEQVRALQSENAKLRKLVADMHTEYMFLRVRVGRNFMYIGHEKRMCAIEQRMRELGVEVD